MCLKTTSCCLLLDCGQLVHEERPAELHPVLRMILDGLVMGLDSVAVIAS